MTFIDEIKQQPDAIRTFVSKYFNQKNEATQTLEALLIKKSYKQIIFTGMGSSLFASYIPCAYLRGKGIAAYAMETGELLNFGQSILGKDTLLVIVSQSGESEEVVLLCEKLDTVSDAVIVTNYETSSLYGYGSAKFEIYAGLEETTASKSYTNTIAMLVYIAYIIAGATTEEFERMKTDLLLAAEKMEEIINFRDDEINNIATLLQTVDYVVVVGSGASYCSASHAELVFEEAGRIYASRYTTGQFIHGPIELIDKKFCAAVFDFDLLARDKVDRILQAIDSFDGKAVLFSNRRIETKHKDLLEFFIDYDNPMLAPLVEIIPVELAVNSYGMAKGLKPGILTRVLK